MDYDKIEKAKELWNRYDEFDRQWLGTRGVFNVMHKIGVLNDEDHKDVLEHYDRAMAPITKFKSEMKAKAVEKISRFTWNKVVNKERTEKTED